MKARTFIVTSIIILASFAAGLYLKPDPTIWLANTLPPDLESRTFTIEAQRQFVDKGFSVVSYREHLAKYPTIEGIVSPAKRYTILASDHAIFPQITDMPVESRFKVKIRPAGLEVIPVN